MQSLNICGLQGKNNMLFYLCPGPRHVFGFIHPGAFPAKAPHNFETGRDK